MRLSYIKLAGFKSFVEPTTLKLPKNLTGIVGPNGCGKSNVIDAVRWVMGESSAKYLRGESMADVIFNGAHGRSPLGMASVELGFDNSDGSLGGEYGAYSEISIRREVKRDGQSSYYLNGTKCRRRDITGIFLGTGLGPRSYAIIGQGTISRLIEAKPEELRIYLEEAAGISKYKERRRETENRMRHTRDNLEKLASLREELTKQLNKLRRQSNDAERYKEYKAKEALYKAQLAALNWQRIDHDFEQQQTLINARQLQQEAIVTDIYHLDATLESQRELQTALGDEFQTIQSAFYTVGGDISRIEQRLQHGREREIQLGEDIEQTAKALAELVDHRESDKAALERLGQEVSALAPEVSRLNSEAEVSQAALEEAETVMQTWQGRWDTFNEAAATSSQQAQVEQTKIRHVEQQIQRSQDRISRLKSELERFELSEFDQTILQLSDACQEESERQETLQQTMESFSYSLKEQRSKNADIALALDEARSLLQQRRGRHASLEALQQAALGGNDEPLLEWLEGNSLTNAPRLAQSLQAEGPWQKAVETVLGDYLEAICVESVDAFCEKLSGLSQGAVTFWETQGNHAGQADRPRATLASKVTSDVPVDAFLANVYLAETLDEALTLRVTLLPHESVIIPEGVWFGANWLRMAREDNVHVGILQREEELKQLNKALTQLSSQVETLQESLAQGQDALQSLENEKEQADISLKESNASLADLSAQLQVKQERVAQLRQREEALTQEIEENMEQIYTYQDELQTAKGHWQAAMSAMEEDAEKREALQKQRDVCREQLDTARQAYRVGSNQAHELALSLKTKQAQLQSLSHNLERLDKQQIGLEDRYQQMKESLITVTAPFDEQQEQLDAYLETRLQIEEKMQGVRERLDQVEQGLRQQDKQRHEKEKERENIQGEVQKALLARQAMEVRRTNIEEQLQAMESDLAAVLANMPEEASIQTWEVELERIASRINRLGPINLAAIDEYAEAQARSEYYDTQQEDLEKALNTLEEAIAKIDKETRHRFKETYETVNNYFKQLFPKIFGGGSAYLELTGDDLLDTGMSVMARPPGKRNSTIHLLSGGEKALTAVALVFAIFQLNPAPFCMLDEVDAPLDDTNVGRYSRLLKEMSDNLQFIFISHNKPAMEIAEQLMGVTMSEPGVSRLVTVDVEEAAAMATV